MESINRYSIILKIDEISFFSGIALWYGHKITHSYNINKLNIYLVK